MRWNAMRLVRMMFGVTVSKVDADANLYLSLGLVKCRVVAESVPNRKRTRSHD
jgi:hypothetical protein